MENKIVDKMYAFAYLIIKMELRAIGKSRVLNWVKADPVSSSFINKEIEKEIGSLDPNVLANPLLQTALAKVKSQGLDYSYLDDALILYIAIQNNDELFNNIKLELNQLLEAIKNRQNTIDVNNSTIDRLQKEAEDNKKKRKTYAIKTSLKIIGSLSLVASLIFGAVKLIKFSTRATKALTTNEVFSQGEVVQTVAKDDYYAILPEKEKIKVIEYSPWRERLFGGYERNVTTYNVGNIVYDDLEDYLALDLDTLGIEGDTSNEEKDTLVPEDLYDAAILEVEKIIQNTNDTVDDMKIYQLRYYYIHG